MGNFKDSSGVNKINRIDLFNPQVEDVGSSLLCAKNCIDWLEYYKVHGLTLLHCQPDRCYFLVENNFMLDIELINVVKCNYRNHGSYAVLGMRQDISGISPQLIIHKYPDGDDLVFILEMDFDYWNPSADLVGLIGHTVEVLKNKVFNTKTDPKRIRKTLIKRGIVKA